MHKLCHRNRRQSNLKKAVHFIPYSLRIKLHTNRVLHPCICNQYPPCRECCSKSGEPCRCQMPSFTHLVPSKEHYSNKCCLHKNGKNALYYQWCTKNITNKPGVVTPVSTELKLKNKTCGYYYGKVNTEELHPKLYSSFPKLFSCIYI